MLKMLRSLLLGWGMVFMVVVSPSHSLDVLPREDNTKKLIIAHVNPEVMRMIQEAIQNNPNDPQPYLQRGLAYNHLEEYDKALADFAKVIELDPNNVDAYNFRGTMYFRLGDYERALADYNEAMKLNPDYALLYFNRGYVKVELGSIESAIEDFQTGANLAKQQGDFNTYQQAEAVIEKLKVSPNLIR